MLRMRKLIATLTNHPTPLEERLFEGARILEIEMDGPYSPDDVLRALEPKIMEIRGDSRSSLSLVVKTESGSTVLSGGIKDGFHGVWMS